MGWGGVGIINNIVLSQCAHGYVSCVELKEHNYVINTSNRCVKGGKGGGGERERESMGL